MKILVKLICCFVPKKEWRDKIRKKFIRHRLSELCGKIDFVNDRFSALDDKIDLANGRLVWIESMLRTSMDIEKMPMSQGWQRLMHRSGAKMLQLIDIICQDNKIPYFLYGGSLIGAKLYGRSVQWDDDWDIGMLRADWERFRDIAELLFSKSDFNPTFIGISIQFRFRESIIYGDIFPFDQYHSDIKTEQEVSDLENILKQAKQKMDFGLWHWEERLQNRSITIPNIADYRKTKELYNELVMNGKKAAKNGALIENPMNPGFFADGIFKHRTHENNIFRYDWIFPLQRIKYEDTDVYAPNNIDALLGQKYGDIYDLPEHLDTQHGHKVKFSDLKDINDLLTMDMRKVYLEMKKGRK